MTAAVMDDRLFADGVMARLASEPVPTPARALRIAVATLDARLAAGATWTAWHLATSRNTTVRRGVRLRSALLLAMLTLLLAFGTTLAAAGASVVYRQFIDDHQPLLTTSSQGNRPADENHVPAIALQTRAPDVDAGDDDEQGPDEDVTDDPGDDHGGAPGPDDADDPGDDDGSEGDHSGPGMPGGGSGSDEEDGGDDEATEDQGDNSGDDSASGEDEDAPEPTDAPDASDGEGQGQETIQPTDGPDDDSSTDSDPGSSDGGAD